MSQPKKASKSHKHRRILSKTGGASTLPSHCFCKRTELLRRTTGLRADLYGEFANSIVPASKSCLLVLFSRHSCRTIKAGCPSSRSFHSATSQASYKRIVPHYGSHTLWHSNGSGLRLAKHANAESESY